MRVCSRCKLTKEASDFPAAGRQCVECRREINRAKMARRRQRPEWRERMKAYHREWYQRNRETERQKQRAYFEQNREQVIARVMAWREANPDRVRQLQIADRSRRRGPKMTPDDVAFVEILRLDPCSYCGGDAGEADHISPVVTFASNAWSNLTAACRFCNARKNAKPLLMFLLSEAP